MNPTGLCGETHGPFVATAYHGCGGKVNVCSAVSNISESFYERGWADPKGWENLVEFHLLYSGPLHSGDFSGSVKEKHAIRKAFHPQLRRLWNTDPKLLQLAKFDGVKAWNEPNHSRPHPIGDLSPEQLREMGLKWRASMWTRNGFNFIPLVQESFALRCSLDILFLRVEKEKNFILQGGDLDGRLKALFDGLRITQNSQQLPPGAIPEDDEDPFFCLLQDDSLISEVRVNADQLLALPTNKAVDPTDVYLQITVRLNARSNTEYAWIF